MGSAFSSVAFAVAENGLSFVVFGTVAFSLLMSLLFVMTRGTDNLYEQIGQGGLSAESDHGGAGPAAGPESSAAQAEREDEIRQMLRARSDRLIRSGQPALDIDAELTRLLEPTGPSASHDAALVEEVRQLVVARNERRIREGLEPLEVETEVTRTLDELSP